MKTRYSLVCRGHRGGIFYCYDAETRKRESLGTKDLAEANRLVDAKNEAIRQPALNLEMARVYLKASNPKLVERTWQDAMDDYCAGKKASTQKRNARAFKSTDFDSIRHRKLIETTADELLPVIRTLGVFNNHIFHCVHNHALGMGWINWPIVPPKLWPTHESEGNRAITAAEHEKIIQSEKNPERRLYYEFMWETGASQTDAAMITDKNIDWQRRVLSYIRCKTGEQADLIIGSRLEFILRQLPSSGFIFPKQATLSENHRAAEFCRRRRVAGVEGVTLHSYRYAWAERAEECAYPERFAQKALGHASKAVHRAYARGAVVLIPPLEKYQQQHSNIVSGKGRTSYRG